VVMDLIWAIIGLKILGGGGGGVVVVVVVCLSDNYWLGNYNNKTRKNNWLSEGISHWHFFNFMVGAGVKISVVKFKKILCNLIGFFIF